MGRRPSQGWKGFPHRRVGVRYIPGSYIDVRVFPPQARRGKILLSIMAILESNHHFGSGGVRLPQRYHFDT